MSSRGRELPQGLLDHDGPRLLLINNMPAYYRTAPFLALIQRFEREAGGVGLVAYQVRRDSHGRGEWFYTPDEDLPYEHYVSSPDTKRSAHVTRYPLRLDPALWVKYMPTHIFTAGWDSPLSVTAAAYARFARARLGVWIESNRTTSRHTGLASNAFRRTLLRSADFLVVPTRASAEYVHDLAAAPSRIRQLLNPAFWPRIPDETEVEEKRLIFLGDLSRRKGFDSFVAALASSADWKGIAWGRDTEGLAASAPENLETRGARPLVEIIPYLRASDVMVIPSRIDPAPLTYSESLALGLRVLVSDRIAYGEDAAITSGACRLDTSRPESILFSAESVRRGPRPDRAQSARVTPEHWASGVFEEFMRLA